MLRDNLAGSSSRCSAARGGLLSRCTLTGGSHRTIDPLCLENPRPAGAEPTLTENVASPFQAEPRQSLQAAKKLDDFVRLRGEIAHRGAGQQSVTRFQVDAFLNHVKRLVGKTGKQVNKYVKDATGQAMW
jgi:hypothetical protein